VRITARLPSSLGREKPKGGVLPCRLRPYGLLHSSRSLLSAVQYALPDSVEAQARMIKVFMNGEEREIPEGLTLSALLAWLKLPADRVAVERNLEIVARNQWDQIPIQAGDKLEVVHFVGGGVEGFKSRLSPDVSELR